MRFSHPLIYDWNDDPDAPKPHPVMLDDETLRDGLQSPSVQDPPIEDKIRILHLMHELGIHTADIGLPGAGPRAYNDTLALAREIVQSRLSVAPNCAARTMIRDIDPIIDISQKVGVPIMACVFLGSSPIRQHVEGWNIDFLLERTEEAVTYAVKHDLPVMYVTEDTTRAHPDTLEKLYRTAVQCGAQAVCIADTVGHATPRGAYRLTRFIREIVDRHGENIVVDWHGHRDRGLDIANVLAAIEGGANRVHGAAIGIGERAGNAPMELILVNLKLLGYIDNDLSRLKEYCETVSRAVGVPIPNNYPVVGRDAFRTATGVHAAAVIKALERGDEMLANLVYSGVPAHLFGLRQIVEIGPLSGRSNVIYWLKSHGYEPEDNLVDLIFQHAKQSDHILSDAEIEQLIAHAKSRT